MVACMSNHAKRCLLLLAAFITIGALLYGGNDGHEFHLDSPWGLRDNPAIRDLANIPSYFTDPYTLTTLQQNVDYRPVLQITYALNYAMGGTEMAPYHWTNIVLHALNAFFLFLLAWRWVPYLVDEPSDQQRWLLALAVGVLFLIHPTAAGVVNYQWARSSMLVAAFLLPALCLWMDGRMKWAALFYALALFTKVEAVGALGAFALWEVYRARLANSDGDDSVKSSFWGDMWCVLDKPALKRLAPILLITGAYALIRNSLLPDAHVLSRSNPDVTHLDYLLTQTVAWWHYVAAWWAPVGLVADNLTFPVYRSLLEPAVLMAVTGWVAVAFVLWSLYARHPALMILTLSALAIISPTSSFMPLTEMVNEHRPYLPVALLSIAWIVPLGAALQRLSQQGRAHKPALMGVCAVIVSALLLLSVVRTQAFTTWPAYWEDVVSKAPSWRSHTNLGWWLMGQNRLDEAERHYDRALSFGFCNPFLHINRGALYGRRGANDKARAAYDQAVECDPFNTVALEHRGHFLVRQKDWAAAFKDLQAAEGRSLQKHPLYLDLTTAAAGVGDWQTAVESTLNARGLNETGTAEAIVTMITPFWESPAQYALGIKYFEKLADAWPKQWWIHANWASLAQRLGQVDLAQRQHAISEGLK
jgi:hypothetical protein